VGGREVFELVWTHERYTCHGVPVHSPLYYEYPEVLATITRDVGYGLKFGLGTFSIDPFLPPVESKAPAVPGGGETSATTASGFAWSIGGVAVEYNAPSRVCFALPVEWPHGLRTTVTGLTPNAKYGYNSSASSGAATADEGGVVQVTLRVSAGVTSCLVLQSGTNAAATSASMPAEHEQQTTMTALKSDDSDTAPFGRWAGDPPPQKHLFVDNALFATNLTGDISLAYHRPVDAGVVLVPDKPWETFGYIGYHSVVSAVVDGAVEYRLYYDTGWTLPTGTDFHRYTCLATSTDGKSWVKPDLGLSTFNGSTANNIVWPRDWRDNTHAAGTVFFDTNPAAAADEKWKMVAQ
jgi:hypothetical protein